jgi:hypothetical protein
MTESLSLISGSNLQAIPSIAHPHLSLAQAAYARLDLTHGERHLWRSFRRQSAKYLRHLGGIRIADPSRSQSPIRGSVYWFKSGTLCDVEVFIDL